MCGRKLVLAKTTQTAKKDANARAKRRLCPIFDTERSFSPWLLSMVHLCAMRHLIVTRRGSPRFVRCDEQPLADAPIAWSVAGCSSNRVPRRPESAHRSFVDRSFVPFGSASRCRGLVGWVGVGRRPTSFAYGLGSGRSTVRAARLRRRGSDHLRSFGALVRGP